MPLKIPQATNPTAKLHVLDRLSKQIGVASQTSLNTVDQQVGMDKVRSVGRSTQFTFNQSQIPVISSRQQASNKEQTIQ